MPETLEILYRDEALVAIHKPSGLLTHKTDIDRHETRFAVQILRDQIGQKVWPAHRLDKGTSGILLFALSAELAATVGRQFEAGSVDKTYQAIVRGHPPAEGRIDYPLSRQRDAYEGQPMQASEEAQAAVTDYRRLATVELSIAVDRYPTSRYAHLALTPLTGRKHQLRRHLKHIAHPIIGDATYGKGRHNRMFAEQFGCQRMLLCCTQLAIDHPLDGRRLKMETPPADDFAGV
ncbi:MAG TPA: pseudouridine synthase, partial [Rhodocyclaceae bacterium]|nr:pseudouridine synthase [Rhodocyclaceae bacterium]